MCKRHFFIRPIFQTICITTALLGATFSSAEFDWGNDCEDGEGNFSQLIPYRDRVVVGDIPVNKRNVYIELISSTDVDLQLIDKMTDTQIIAWPDGLLNGPTIEEITYDGVVYRYSGYNGIHGNIGHEFIEIIGDTNRELEVTAYGYASGLADVTYYYEATPTCYEIGSGYFEQFVPDTDTVVVGTIPVEKTNVIVELNAQEGRDLDLQLIDETTGTQIVGWPNGLLNSPNEGEVSYAGMTIHWSGYNGVDGVLGHEWIDVIGTTTVPLTVRAFGYTAGTADVTYEWGVGVGKACITTAKPTVSDCAAALICKPIMRQRTSAGECHTPPWCLSDKLATLQCAGLSHQPGKGRWTCELFTCEWLPQKKVTPSTPVD